MILNDELAAMLDNMASALSNTDRTALQNLDSMRPDLDRIGELAELIQKEDANDAYSQ